MRIKQTKPWPCSELLELLEVEELLLVVIE
jgi:hypothetical protein